MVGSGELIGVSELEPRDGLPMPMRLIGISLNGGLAMGRAVLHNTNFSLSRLYADDTKPAVKTSHRNECVARQHRDDVDRLSDGEDWADMPNRAMCWKHIACSLTIADGSAE